MKKVYSVSEAMEWFLENHSGSVICVKHGVEKEVSSFGAAKKFFDESQGEGHV